jgi:hypothetical protein
MTQFFTKVDIPQPDFSIDYSSKLLFLGSCFAENIGKRTIELKFNTCLNPFGVLYNPLSLANSLELLVDAKPFRKEDLAFQHELWFSYFHYTIFSDIDPEKCLEKINNSLVPAQKFIRHADVLFITLGTSWVYKLITTGQVVANCHKLPSQHFERIFSTVENSSAALKESIDKLRKINPSVKIVFTVSPIRHFKDGAIENQRSKAALILTIADLIKECAGIYYFPAYEIFMDELRDYRFYAEDMIHPSDTAIEYTWNLFNSTFINEKSKLLAFEIQKLVAGINHRPRHINTLAYKKFVNTLSQKLVSLAEQNQFLDFTRELDYLRQIDIKTKEI